jgi:hypothetical protein
VAQIPLASHTRTLVVNGGTADDPAWPTGWVKAALRAAVNELAGMPIGVVPAGRIDGGHHTVGAASQATSPSPMCKLGEMNCQCSWRC